MSFFGFDASLPRDKPSTSSGKGIFEQSNPFSGIQQARKLQAFQDAEDDILNFDDTYDGLGDRLEETGDDFNDDTFGGGAEGVGVGRDFDFSGNTAQVSNAIDEEAVRYGLQTRSQPPVQETMQKPKRSGYEKYEDPGYIPDIQAKSGFWGSRSQPPSQLQTQPQQPPTQQPPTQQPPTQSSDDRISTARNNASRKMMSLEEVEASMRSHGRPQPSAQPPFPLPPHQIAQQGYLPSENQQPFPTQQAGQFQTPPLRTEQEGLPHQRQPPPGMNQGPVQANVPLQILQNPNRSRHSPHPSMEQRQGQPGHVPPLQPNQLMELSDEQRMAYLEEDAKRAKRNHKIFVLSKGNGLMTPQDKNFITRIQLQQLVTVTGGSADPEAALTEDFYYQVYSQIRGAPRQHPTQPLGHFAQTYLLQTGNRQSNRRQTISGDNHMQRMQQQVQRAVEAAKLKPKNKQLIIEGSLGKISFSNAKTPKPLLNIKRNDSHDGRPQSAKKAASAVSPSDRKTILRNIESVYATLMRMEDQERQMPPSPTEGDTESEQAHSEWHQELAGLNSQLWQQLKVLDPIVQGSTVAHPFIALLAFSKGKKLVPRVFRQIDTEQRVTILTMIVVHLDQLDVVRNAQVSAGESQPPAAVREEIEQFSQSVMPSLLAYVSEAPINIMIGLLQLLIDHTNVIHVARTKIGLGMMTMLLSRAELVKETGTVSNPDWQQWVGNYNRLFDTLEPVLCSVFPGPVNSGDDMYVWQFLAAVGIGASPEQQQRLVLSVKDRVMDTIMQSKALPPEMSQQRLSNVNLFMRAIGLDVDMLG